MNKSYLLTILGILCNTLGIAFVFPILNIGGFILLTIGAVPLSGIAKPFKTLRNLSITAIPFSILSLAILTSNTGAMQHTINCVVIGINVFFVIYNSYFLTSGINTYARTINKMASTRGSMTSWTLFGITIFLYFMAYSSALIELVMMVLTLILLAFGLYFLFTLYGYSKTLFETTETP